MDYDDLPSGPVGHIGISLALASLFRLNPVVTVCCGILPDLVDKPASAVLETGGRYIGHTLLFVILVALSLWRWKYGMAAIVGGISHLVLDLNNLVPWFYPFKEYDFPQEKYDWSWFSHEYFAVDGMGQELIWVVVAGVVAFLSLWLYRWCNRRS